VAIYRDGSKKAQPLMAAAKREEAARRGTRGDRAPVISKEESDFGRLAPEQQAFAMEVVRIVNSGPGSAAASSAGSSSSSIPAAVKEHQGLVIDAVRRLIGPTKEDQQNAPPKALRHRLPVERASITHKFSIAGHEGYVTVGLYKDGTPGELFIRMAKEGSTISGLMDSFATAISLALQHGVPLRLLCEKFTHTRFEPSGFTGNTEIPIAKSVMDYIFRWLEIRFVTGKQYPLFKEMQALSTQQSALREGSGAQLTGGPQLTSGAQPPSAAEEIAETTPPQGAIASGQKLEASSLHLPDRGIHHPSNALRDVIDMGDAPSCHVCGAIMTRNGSCYRCMSCGSTSGCS
jgi:ribonucleoside-diphosphate reductase alpha chain